MSIILEITPRYAVAVEAKECAALIADFERELTKGGVHLDHDRAPLILKFVLSRRVLKNPSAYERVKRA